MRIFKTKYFAKWARKNKVDDTSLKEATTEIAEGIFEANLGGFVIKKRIATKGRGKRGSVRTIVAFKKKGNCFFVYGFEKNVKSNISTSEEKAFKIIARELLNFSDPMLDRQVKGSRLFEVTDE